MRTINILLLGDDVDLASFYPKENSNNCEHEFYLDGFPAAPQNIKTALIKRLVDGDVPDSFLGSDFNLENCVILVDNEPVELVIWNTDAQTNPDSVAKRQLLCKHVDVAVLVFSVTDPLSLKNAREKWIQLLKEETRPEVKVRDRSASVADIAMFSGGWDLMPLILAGGHANLRENPHVNSALREKNLRPIDPRTGEQEALSLGCEGYVEFSALSGDGVERVFIEAARAGLVVRQNYLKL
eukprot:GCRY01002747.1.p1 GENE.GCRY01002747.1~~GCRY01002747.1.p1  ORF type:complete len:240 (+),score=40.33 GCRY01002747.1:223-942(+)